MARRRRFCCFFSWTKAAYVKDARTVETAQAKTWSASPPLPKLSADDKLPPDVKAQRERKRERERERRDSICIYFCFYPSCDEERERERDAQLANRRLASTRVRTALVKTSDIRPEKRERTSGSENPRSVFSCTRTCVLLFERYNTSIL